MICSKCGYAMDALDSQCPKCAAQAKTPGANRGAEPTRRRKDGSKQNIVRLSAAIGVVLVAMMVAIGLNPDPPRSSVPPIEPLTGPISSAPDPTASSLPAPAVVVGDRCIAGTTAICSDGSLSFSANRQGTCSHHGGVARWCGETSSAPSINSSPIEQPKKPPRSYTITFAVDACPTGYRGTYGSDVLDIPIPAPAAFKDEDGTEYRNTAWQAIEVVQIDDENDKEDIGLDVYAREMQGINVSARMYLNGQLMASDSGRDVFLKLVCDSDGCRDKSHYYPGKK